MSLDICIEVAGGRRWTAMIVDNQDSSSLVVFEKPLHSVVDILKSSKACLGARVFISLKKCYEKFSPAAEALAGVSISFV